MPVYIRGRANICNNGGDGIRNEGDTMFFSDLHLKDNGGNGATLIGDTATLEIENAEVSGNKGHGIHSEVDAVRAIRRELGIDERLTDAQILRAVREVLQAREEDRATVMRSSVLLQAAERTVNVASAVVTLMQYFGPFLGG